MNNPSFSPVIPILKTLWGAGDSHTPLEPKMLLRQSKMDGPSIGLRVTVKHNVSAVFKDEGSC